MCSFLYLTLFFHDDFFRGERLCPSESSTVNRSLAKSRQMRSVDVPLMPVDCELSNWSSWTACDPCQKKRVRAQALGRSKLPGALVLHKTGRGTAAGACAWDIVGPKECWLMESTGLFSWGFQVESIRTFLRSFSVFQAHLSLRELPVSNLLSPSIFHGTARES